MLLLPELWLPMTTIFGRSKLRMESFPPPFVFEKSSVHRLIFAMIALFDSFMNVLGCDIVDFS
jgi:hypothetical protein